LSSETFDYTYGSCVGDSTLDVQRFSYALSYKYIYLKFFIYQKGVKIIEGNGGNNKLFRYVGLVQFSLTLQLDQVIYHCVLLYYLTWTSFIPAFSYLYFLPLPFPICLLSIKFGLCTDTTCQTYNVLPSFYLFYCYFIIYFIFA
jgi:hypothetical protein